MADPWPLQSHDGSRREALVLVELQPFESDDPRNILRLQQDNIVACLDLFPLTLVPSGSCGVVTSSSSTYWIRGFSTQGPHRTVSGLGETPVALPDEWESPLPWRPLRATQVAVNQCDGQAIWQSRFESVRHRIVSPLCIQEQCLTTREGIARRIITKL